MKDLIERQAILNLFPTHDWKHLYEAVKDLPSAQPDLSDFCDRLWKAAYERGKAEAQPDIIHCGECKHRDPEDHKCDCGHDILWQLPRDDEWYCADAERKEGEADDDDT